MADTLILPAVGGTLWVVSGGHFVGELILSLLAALEQQKY